MAHGLGDRIRKRRKARGWTLADLAEATGLSVPYLSDLERREGVNPTLETLSVLARALECTVADLIDAEGTLEPTSAPPSMSRFVRSQEFRDEVTLLAQRTGRDPKRIEEDLIRFLAVAPRRSTTGDLSPTDWRRLLDVFRIITYEQ